MTFSNPDKPPAANRVVGAIMAIAIAGGIVFAWHSGVFTSPPPEPPKLDTELSDPIPPPVAPTKAGKDGKAAKAAPTPAMVSPVTGKPVPDPSKPLVDLHQH